METKEIENLEIRGKSHFEKMANAQTIAELIEEHKRFEMQEIQLAQKGEQVSITDLLISEEMVHIADVLGLEKAKRQITEYIKRVYEKD